MQAQASMIDIEVHWTNGIVENQSHKESDLIEAVQDIVGGDVERVVLGEGKIALVNEDGRPLNLQINKSMPRFCGNAVVMEDSDLD